MQYVVYHSTNDSDDVFWTGKLAPDGSHITGPLVMDARKFLTARAAYDAAGAAAEKRPRMTGREVSLLDFKVRPVDTYERRLEADYAAQKRIRLAQSEQERVIEAAVRARLKERLRREA